MRKLRQLIFWICTLFGATSVRADPLEELVRIHKEAIGGSRLAEFSAIEAMGKVRTGDHELAFEFVAARPNRIRLTIRADKRTLMQASDGISPPWQSDSEKQPTTQTMTGETAREFMADAEFDDPLASPPERGFVLDYAGETNWSGRSVLKVLVTRGDTAPSFLLLDPETYFIVARLTKKRQPSGREVTIETRYDDFRPVAGVIFSHRVTQWTEGVLERETVLSDIHAIAEPPPETFARPLLAGPAAPLAP